MTHREERLRFLRLGNGARQVVECGPRDPAETSAAKTAIRSRCNKCRQFIGRTPFHMVNGEYYHVDCTKVF